jgi:hypothetical protein
MADIIWEDPPPVIRKGRATSPVFDACRQNPGRWAVFSTGRSTGHSASQWAMNRRAEGFEFTSRRQPDDTYTTYVRYVPKDEA